MSLSLRSIGGGVRCCAIMATREAANRDTWGASLANVCAVSKSDANGGIVIIRASINFKTGIRVGNYERNVANQHMGQAHKRLFSPISNESKYLRILPILQRRHEIRQAILLSGDVM